MTTRYRVGNGFDFHPMRSGTAARARRRRDQARRGLRGHSDADVATHALANAILGALGEGDLGRHFPDSDPRYKDADSIALLADVWKLASDRGWRLVNADLTIFAERPRLTPYVDAMRERLAATLGADQSRSTSRRRVPKDWARSGAAKGWRPPR